MKKISNLFAAAFVTIGFSTVSAQGEDLNLHRSVLFLCDSFATIGVDRTSCTIREHFCRTHKDNYKKVDEKNHYVGTAEEIAKQRLADKLVFSAAIKKDCPTFENYITPIR